MNLDSGRGMGIIEAGIVNQAKSETWYLRKGRSAQEEVKGTLRGRLQDDSYTVGLERNPPRLKQVRRLPERFL